MRQETKAAGTIIIIIAGITCTLLTREPSIAFLFTFFFIMFYVGIADRSNLREGKKE